MRTTLSLFSDRELLAEPTRLAVFERQATAKLLAALAELDSRRLYLGEGCSSLFMYCTQVLHLSEPAAYSRITAARAARRFPTIFEMLANGDINLTTISLLASHLDDDNHVALLEAARHKSKRDVERLVAAIDPKPDVISQVRKVPSAGTAEVSRLPMPVKAPADLPNRATVVGCPVSTNPAPNCHPILVPFAGERYYLKVTVSQETHNKLQRARDLLRHAVPNGDLAEVIDRALTALLVQLDKTRGGAPSRSAVKRESANPRHIPAAVKRAVWTRDQGRCAFDGPHGRCTETGFLEYDHVHPFAEGGHSTVDNLELRCRAHNAHETQVHLAAVDLVAEPDCAALE